MAVWAWYTKGRRLPTLIGKDISGNRIPGGPYTGLQAVTVLIVPSVAWCSRGLWAADMAGLMMLGTIILVTVAAVKLVGKADFASRNPLLLLHSYLREMIRPAGGLVAGRRVPDPRPHRIRDTAETAETPPPSDGSVQPDGELEGLPAAPSRPQDQVLVDDDLAAAEPAAASPPETASTPTAEMPPARPVIQPTTPTPTPAPRRSALEDFLSAAKAGPSVEKDAA